MLSYYHFKNSLLISKGFFVSFRVTTEQKPVTDTPNVMSKESNHIPGESHLAIREDCKGERQRKIEKVENKHK
jgi:hypothetical protein